MLTHLYSVDSWLELRMTITAQLGRLKFVLIRFLHFFFSCPKIGQDAIPG